jgi:hypothetical protein
VDVDVSVGVGVGVGVGREGICSTAGAVAGAVKVGVAQVKIVAPCIAEARLQSWLQLTNAA